MNIRYPIYEGVYRILTEMICFANFWQYSVLVLKVSKNKSIEEPK